MHRLKATAPAKINLSLHVLGRRDDGYHELESLIAFANFGDEIEVSESDALTLSVVGDFSSALSGDSENNLVLKAARLLQSYAEVKRGASVRLTKNLPVASGIGGGSSDAATAMLLLSKLWGISLSTEKLQKLATPLGADLAACITRQTVYVSGIGERLEKGPQLTGIPILLVNPNKPLATASVFSKIVPPYTQTKASHVTGSMRPHELAEYLRPLRNDLEEAAVSLMPEIGEMRQAIASLPCCLLVRMSGSGATCFGLFESAETGKQAEQMLRKLHSGWWIRGGVLI